MRTNKTIKVDPTREKAFLLLREFTLYDTYSNLSLSQWIQDAKNQQITKTDRNFLFAMFYGTITWLYSLDFYLQKYMTKDLVKVDLILLNILRLGAWQIIYSRSVPSFAAVDSSVQLAKKYYHQGGVSFVNGILRKLGQDFDNGVLDRIKAKFPVRYGLKPELAGLFLKWFGEETAGKIAESFLEEPSLTIRTNDLLIQPEALKIMLEARQMEVNRPNFMPLAWKIQLNGELIHQLEEYQQGLFVVQDEAAMLPGYILDPKRGEKILDACAAPGGKTGYMAQKSKNQAEIVAVDINQNRLKLLQANMARLKISGVEVEALDILQVEKMKPEWKYHFDKVLLDAPCSGLGLLGRKPDIRQQMTYNKIQELVILQAQLLDAVKSCVKPGGRLIYSTCTINPEENSEQIKKFVEYNPDFYFESLKSYVPSGLLSHLEVEEGYLQVLPHEDHCDGFFVASLRRKNI